MKYAKFFENITKDMGKSIKEVHRADLYRELEKIVPQNNIKTRQSIYFQNLRTEICFFYEDRSRKE